MKIYMINKITKNINISSNPFIYMWPCSKLKNIDIENGIY